MTFNLCMNRLIGHLIGYLAFELQACISTAWLGEPLQLLDWLATDMSCSSNGFPLVCRAKSGDGQHAAIGAPFKHVRLCLHQNSIVRAIAADALSMGMTGQTLRDGVSGMALLGC